MGAVQPCVYRWVQKVSQPSVSFRPLLTHGFATSAFHPKGHTEPRSTIPGSWGCQHSPTITLEDPTHQVHPIQ